MTNIIDCLFLVSKDTYITIFFVFYIKVSFYQTTIIKKVFNSTENKKIKYNDLIK